MKHKKSDPNTLKEFVNQHLTEEQITVSLVAAILLVRGGLSASINESVQNAVALIKLVQEEVE